MKKFVFLFLLISFLFQPVFAANGFTKFIKMYPTHKLECLSGLHDDKFDFHFQNEKQTMDFSIYNKTQDSYMILWDRVAFIDVNGYTHRVIHNGVKFAEKSNQQVPSILPPNGKIQDSLIPVDNIVWATNHWLLQPLLGVGNWENIEGKQFTINIPLQLDNQIHTYTFTFKVLKCLD